MGVIDRDVDNILDLIKEKKWSAKNRTSETALEDELYEFLHAEMPEENFLRQRLKGSGRGDIYVRLKDKFLEPGREVILELKLNLKERLEYLRLVGQMYDYNLVYKYEVLIIIVGECEPSLLKLTKEAAGFFQNCFDHDLCKKVRFLHIT